MHALEKEMATHSSMLAWRIPEMEEPGWLPSMGSHRVGHDWSDLATAAAASENHRSSPLFRHTNDSPLKSHGALIYWGWYDSPGLSHSEDILTYTHTHVHKLTHTHTPSPAGLRHIPPCRAPVQCSQRQSTLLKFLEAMLGSRKRPREKERKIRKDEK